MAILFGSEYYRPSFLEEIAHNLNYGSGSSPGGNFKKILRDEGGALYLHTRLVTVDYNDSNKIYLRTETELFSALTKTRAIALLKEWEAFEAIREIAPDFKTHY